MRKREAHKSRIRPHFSQRGRDLVRNNPISEERVDMQYESQLRVLFVQKSPDIRATVLASMLKMKGHHAELAYLEGEEAPWLADTFSRSICLDSPREVWDLARQYDLLMLRSPSGTSGAFALASGTPYVQDAVYVAGAEVPGMLELQTNLGAGARIFSCKKARDAYSLAQGITTGLEVPHGLLRWHLPKRLSKKNSKSDGVLRAAILGTFGSGGGRMFTKFLPELTTLGMQVNLYYWNHRKEYEELFARYPNVTSHRPTFIGKLIQELSSNDFGIPSNGDQYSWLQSDGLFSHDAGMLLAANLPLLILEDAPFSENMGASPVGTLQSGRDMASAVNDCLEAGRRYEVRNFVRLLDPLVESLTLVCREAFSGAKESGGSELQIFTGNSIANQMLSCEGRERNQEEEPDWELYSLRARRRLSLVQEGKTQESPSSLASELDRLVRTSDIKDAIELGCGQGWRAQHLQEMHGLMVLGVDVVDKLVAPGVKLHKGVYWELPSPADFVYSVDAMQLINEQQVSMTLQTASERSPLLFVATAEAPRTTQEAENKGIFRSSNWWHAQVLQYFAQVSSRSEPPELWLECRRDVLDPVCNAARMDGYKSWTEVTGLPVTHYREIWNRHARSLPWHGRILFVGSNNICRQYYNREFFQCEEVLHIDPDPRNKPDVVTIGEKLEMFADGSIDGVAFFGTPYVMNDPARFISEAYRVLKPGGMAAGGFNGSGARWDGKPYTLGAVKTVSEQWTFDLGTVLGLLGSGWDLRYTARMNRQYYLTTASKCVSS